MSQPLREQPDPGDPGRTDPIDLFQALGGRRGIADSGLPALAFVIAFTASGGELSLAIWTAIGLAGALTAIRLARRETLQFALAGFVGVALSAFVASRTGRAEDFFLPGLLLNMAYASAYLISIVVRWPLLGVILATLTGEGMGWRKEPHKLRAYSKASWIWVGVFTVRLAVQLPLWLTGSLLALGIARTAMGIPIFAIAIWLSYLVLRQAGVLPERLTGGAGEPGERGESGGSGYAHPAPGPRDEGPRRGTSP